MIFNSIPTMSTIDGLILGIVLFGFGYAVYRRHEIHFGNAKFGSFLIGLGLFILGGFYTYDLIFFHYA